MKVVSVLNEKLVKKTKKEYTKEVINQKNNLFKKFVSHYKVAPTKEPIYVVEMTSKELQLVNFYLEYEKRQPITMKPTKHSKPKRLEDIENWLSKKTFYGTAKNEPNEIHELKFERLDFRPEADILLIHFKVLNSWATNIFYDILDYGKMWALTKEKLL